MLKNRSLYVLLISFALSGCGSEEAAPAITAEQFQQLRSSSEAYAGRSIAQLQSDALALAQGQELFIAHCSQCHGSDAQGLDGAANLAVGVLDYGATEEAIRTTITAGRQSTMPALGSTLGEVELGALVAYVRSLSSGEELSTFGETAKILYAENCVVCHGQEARGNPVLGTPNLTDNYWQHGESMMNVRLNITRGVQSVCPPHAGILSNAEIELLTAWVLETRKAAGLE